MQQMDGDYVGIGVMVTQDKNTKEFVVTGVIKNSPAEDAGMLEKDVIIKVDGQDVTNCDLDKLVSLVRGKKGTGVSITVTRENEEIEFQLDRAEVSEQIVYYEMLDDNIGYIELTQFSENSAEQVKDALEELKSQNMEKLIFDVRDNPGGDLQQILKIAGYFIPKDEIILSYKMKDGSGEDYKNDTEGEYQDIPMVVLVNEDSASAAEAFSGCMKAYKRATIVGTNTYGKGIMQTLYQLDDGSAVKITIAKYYLPDGSNIQDVGIAPDVEVEEDENINIWDLEKRDSEPQFQKALEVIKGIS
jgi:carboxyl-terminal processing protease